MRLKDLETYLNREQPEFFQFAMVLTADEDVSQEIIKDAQYLLLAEERAEIEAQLKNVDTNPGSFFRTSKRSILSAVFRIARKNNLFQHPGTSSNEKVEYHAYWNMPMDQLAVLCLRHRMKFSKEEITEILNITKVEYFNLLNLSREALLKNAGGLGQIRETF